MKVRSIILLGVLALTALAAYLGNAQPAGPTQATDHARAAVSLFEPDDAEAGGVFAIPPEEMEINVNSEPSLAQNRLEPMLFPNPSNPVDLERSADR